MNQEVNTVPQELVSTREEEIARKEKEDRKEIIHGINDVPQETSSTLVEVVIHEVPAQTGNEGDESIPNSLFQSFMPRGARGFHSPK